MWFFDLVIIALLSVVAYQVLNRRIVNNTGLKDLIKKYGDEINTVTLTFNRTAVDNVTRLDAKIGEAREMIRLLEKKGDEHRKLLAEFGEEKKKQESVLKEKARTENQARILGKLNEMIQDDRKKADPGLAEREARERDRKAKDKQTVVLACFGEGRSVQEIADKLDISPEEVRYYIGKGNET